MSTTPPDQPDTPATNTTGGKIVENLGGTPRIAAYLFDRLGVGGLIIVAIAYWVRPHIDDIILEHKKYLSAQTAATVQLVELHKDQAEQLESMARKQSEITFLLQKQAESMRIIAGQKPVEITIPDG